MARIIHGCDNKLDGKIVKIITYNEDSEHPGVTVRYSDLGSCALMMAYCFNGVRKAVRLLTEDEAAAYREARINVYQGSGI